MCLVPVSLIGLIVYGIGLLGFTPFLTCVVFCRNASQAMRHGTAAGSKRVSLPLFLLGVMLGVVIPVCICWMAGPWIEHLIKSLPRPHEWFDHNPLGLQ